MTYQELVEKLAISTGITRVQADKIIKALTNIIFRSLKEGQTVKLPKLGRFVSMFKPSKEVITPQGNKVRVADRFKPRFKFSNSVIQALKQN